jgi:glycosyltransferase involved in cell wall biosynthesis
MKLSIIIPLYNEEQFIEEVLRDLDAISYPAFVESREIIVVDDCSTDLSLATANSYSKDKGHIHIVAHEKNEGKGAAIQTGIFQAKGDTFLFQDADKELSPADIPSMLQTMNDLNVQFINGSRYMPGIIRPLYAYRRYKANQFLTWLTSVLINVRLTDMACGYKLVKRDLMQKIKLHEKRFGFEAELIIKAVRVKRNNIAEVPVHYFPRHEGEGKKLRNSDAFRILWTIIKYGMFRLS